MVEQLIKSKHLDAHNRGHAAFLSTSNRLLTRQHRDAHDGGHVVVCDPPIPDVRAVHLQDVLAAEHDRDSEHTHKRANDYYSLRLRGATRHSNKEDPGRLRCRRLARKRTAVTA